MRTRTIALVVVVMLVVCAGVAILARATTPHTKVNADVCRQMYRGKPMSEVYDLTNVKGTETPQGLYFQDGDAKLLVQVDEKTDTVASFMCSMPSPKSAAHGEPTSTIQPKETDAQS